MGKLVGGAVLLVIAFSLLLAAATVRAQRPGPIANLLRFAGYAVGALAVLFATGSAMVVIDPGEVGVRHAFGYVDPGPLLAGIRFVPPWSSIERYSTREEQWPTRGEQIEAIEALSSEQMGMHVEVSIRWQIDPMQAPKIFTEIGNEDQIRGAVLNAIRKGVRDGMVQYSINDISKRTQIANTMEGLVDSALVTRPRAGGGNFRIATVTAFFLRDLQPPPQVVQAINNKIAQEQQIETERHRVEVARLVAAALRWEVIDNEVVDEVARRAGLPPDAVAQREERAPGLLERLARALAAGSPELFIATAAVPRVEPDEAAIVQLTERVIAEAAAHGRIVLVGRGAQAVLAQRPDALHVYVVAGKPWRMKLAVEHLEVTPADVEKVVDETDRQRDQYVRTYYGRHRPDVVNYDLVVNTERLGIDGAAALIVDEARRRNWR